MLLPAAEPLLPPLPPPGGGDGLDLLAPWWGGGDPAAAEAGRGSGVGEQPWGILGGADDDGALSALVGDIAHCP